jgi:hypothetical protein
MLERSKKPPVDQLEPAPRFSTSSSEVSPAFTGLLMGFGGEVTILLPVGERGR